MDTPQSGLSLSIPRGVALIIYLYSPLHFSFICQHLFVFFFFVILCCPQDGAGRDFKTEGGTPRLKSGWMLLRKDLG